MSQLDRRIWTLVSPLIDQALDLPPEGRRELIDAIPPHDPEAAASLRRLLSVLDRTDHAVDLEDIELFDLATLRRAVDGPSTTGAALTEYAAGEAFAGTDRYEVLRVLGAGGMGVVYEVRDRDRDEIVALKTFRRASPADLLRLKSEFRALADIAHDNLACLYDLVADASHCFFTMERVHGVDFVAFLSGDEGRQPTGAHGRPLRSVDTVRHVLRQLVEGIQALHDRGKLHRDIKPANILVTASQRVVVLDFGLTADAVLVHAADLPSAGTPAYLAPERRAGGAPSEAADWFAVGATLFEGLVGTRLQAGVPAVAGQLPDARERAARNALATIPDDLANICSGLLDADPARRLTGRDVLARLAGAAAAASPSPGRVSDARLVRFVGRLPQLTTLRRALESVSRGLASTVLVHGPSGMGKSALVRQFARDLGPSPLFLHGRCYEHEALPYNAVDNIVDQLSRHLSSLSGAEAAALLPADLGTLARLFPVLRQVPAIARRADAGTQDTDVVSLRRRAFEAFQELLRRLSARCPLVLCFDDLQWADADSRALLDDVLRSPSRAPLLAIACFRSEETARNPWLRDLVARDGVDGCISAPLEPVSADDARDVIHACVPAGVRLPEDTCEDIVRVAAGSPFLLELLARNVAAGHLALDHTDRPAAFLHHRIRDLPPHQQRFLETLAICARPMDASIVAVASGLVGDERPTVAQLRAQHLVRSSGSADRLEVYHDRIREAVTDQLSRDRTRDVHQRMMHALEQNDPGDVDGLFEHARGAGEPHRASVYAKRAGERALDALAFDRAAAYFRAALDPGSPSPASLEQLAETLTHAGRPAEAAERYLEAAHATEGARALELRRRAGEQLLVGGQIDRGLEILATVLEAVGMKLARGPRRAMVSVLWNRLRLRLATSAPVGSAVRMAPDVALRLDTCWSVAVGLALVDTARSADFNIRHLRTAAELGDRRRLTRARLLDRMFTAAGIAFGDGERMAGPSAVTQSIDLEGAADLTALSMLADAIEAFMHSRWRQAAAQCEQALRVLEHDRSASTWVRNITYEFLFGAYLPMGRFKAIVERLAVLLPDARERGNAFLLGEMTPRFALAWLPADRPDEVDREVREAAALWSQRGFRRQHQNVMIANIYLALYRGQPQVAWAEVERMVPLMKRHFFFRMRHFRIEALFLRCRCALLMAESEHAARERMLRLVYRMAGRLQREGGPWAIASSVLFTASADYLAGQRERAIRGLADAAEAFDRADMPLYAAGARVRLSAIVGGERGRALSRQADAYWAAEAVVNVPAMCRLVAPGLPDPSTPPHGSTPHRARRP